MARQTINTGTVANDNTGDTMRNAGTKINANFSEIYTILGGDSVTPTTKMSFGTNSIIAEGATDDAHETTLAFTDPTADRTITFPDETGTVQLTGGTQSLTSAILTTPQIQDTSSNHKYIFASSELDSDTTVNLPLLTDSDTFSFVGFTETLLNKTLTSPVLTTPKFADAGFIADANGNEQVVFQTATSAVNHVEITNAATGAAPAFNAVGSDTNVTMSLAAKGTGSLNLNSKINYTTETLTGTTVAASAVIPVTVHNAGSAVAASLINGTVAGQIKKFVNIGAGAVTLTPATYAQGTTIVLAQHDNAELLWTGSTWYDLGQQTLRDGATLKIGAQTSGLATTIGHATSEVTVGDNLTVTGNLTVSGTTTTVNTQTINAQNALVFEGATADAHETTLSIVDPTGDRTINLPNQSGTLPLLAAVSTTAITSTPEELNILDGATVVVGEINALDLGATAVGTAIASKAVILDTNKDYTGIRNLTITGELDAATLDISGNADIDGTTNLDAVDIDGAVQIDATLSVGVDDTGYDVKLFGDTASAFMLWDASADDLILSGAAGLIVPDGQFTLGSTAVTSTAAELNLLDGVSGLVQADLTKLAAVDSTATELNILDDATLTTAELNILDASAGNTALATDVASSAGAGTSNNFKIKHTLTLAATLADDATHADVVITNDKVLASSVVMASCSLNVDVRIHTVVAGSFKVSVTNKSGGTLADDSTMILNYRII